MCSTSDTHYTLSCTLLTHSGTQPAGILSCKLLTGCAYLCKVQVYRYAGLQTHNSNAVLQQTTAMYCCNALCSRLAETSEHAPQLKVVDWTCMSCAEVQALQSAGWQYNTKQSMMHSSSTTFCVCRQPNHGQVLCKCSTATYYNTADLDASEHTP